MAATNQYHLLSFLPAVESWEMPPALEQLSQQLVQSGLLRINADHQRNYVRHGTADTDQTFTARQLSDPALLAATRALLARHVPPAAGPDGVDDLLERLRQELKKTGGISTEKELKVARCLAQAAHPSVIALVLQGGTQLFVSYSHNVGDLMAVHHWQHHGLASGLQATSDDGTAVYISCGGDPFFEGEEKTYTTDGFPALARMFVIGGQELGHFADLKREGRSIIGRYSTDNQSHALRASVETKAARDQDIARIQQLRQAYERCGLSALLRVEQRAAFYRKQWRYSPPAFATFLVRLVRLGLFQLRCQQAGIALRLRTHPAYPTGQSIAMYLDDMAFNLAPESDAYRHPDPLAEEAIACIEALARVPQQVHKWGPAAVLFGWPQLYRFYYQEVIGGCIRASGGQFRRPIRWSQIQTFIIFIRHLIRKKPGYYPGK
jgi:hypothetical protein